MLKGKTKSGVKYQIDDEGLKKVEWKITKLMMKAYSENQDVQIRAILDLMELVLGGASGMDAFEDAIAKAHGGFLTNEIVIAEYRELLVIVGDALKNSQASPTV